MLVFHFSRRQRFKISSPWLSNVPICNPVMQGWGGQQGAGTCLKNSSSLKFHIHPTPKMCTYNLWTLQRPVFLQCARLWLSLPLFLTPTLLQKFELAKQSRKYLPCIHLLVYLFLKCDQHLDTRGWDELHIEVISFRKQLSPTRGSLSGLRYMGSMVTGLW
jgi:hypothetical protein